MSGPSDPNPSDNAEPAPKKGDVQITGISILSGDESALSSDDKALLHEFNRIAKRMGLHPQPILGYFEGEADSEGHPLPYPTAVSLVHDGVPVVLISEAKKQLVLDGKTGEAGTPYRTSALERLVADAAHEEAHIKHKDVQRDTRNHDSPLKQIREELAADREAARATCNPQAQKDSLETDYLTFARQEGKSLQQIYLEEVTSPDPHPFPPTRYAQMDYMKAHPPRGCKAK